MNDDKEVKVEQVSIEEPVAEAPVDAPDVDTQSPIDELNAQIAELNDKYLRIAAELENTRRRAALDAESAARTRAMNISRNFLPVMDAADAALKHAPDDAGIIAMQRALESAFEQIGITKITSVGEILNPALHNAIQVVDAPDGIAPNTVMEEMQTGYMFGDNVLRPAMVVVSK